MTAAPTTATITTRMMTAPPRATIITTTMMTAPPTATITTTTMTTAPTRATTMTTVPTTASKHSLQRRLGRDGGGGRAVQGDGGGHQRQPARHQVEPGDQLGTPRHARDQEAAAVLAQAAALHPSDDPLGGLILPCFFKRNKEEKEGKKCGQERERDVSSDKMGKCFFFFSSAFFFGSCGNIIFIFIFCWSGKESFMYFLPSLYDALC